MLGTQSNLCILNFQSHVIKPVLTRFDHIVNASGLGGTGAPGLHFIQ